MNYRQHQRRAIVGTRYFLASAMLLFGAAAARAMTIDDIRVEGWYGTGVNRAVTVVDFGPGNGDADSFAFGVNFGNTKADTITGYQMLQMAIQGTSHALDCDAIYYSAYDSWLVNEMWYTDPRTSQLHDVSDYTMPVWWGYWNSGDAGATWSFSDIGSGDTVSDGSVVGWAVESNDDQAWPPSSVPVTPFNAVPEPSTAVLALIAGVAALICGRRQRRK